MIDGPTRIGIDDRRRLLPQGYLAAQSASIVVWWLLLWWLPGTREAFAPSSLGGMRWLLQFLPADVVTVIGGALAAGWWRRYAGRLGLVLCLIGISTQTLACLSVPLRTRGNAGWVGAAIMLAASVATLACAGLMLVETRATAGVFRAAPAMWTPRQIAWRTAGQSAVLWPVFLLALPWVLTQVERAAGWTPPTSRAAMAVRLAVGATLFVVAGSVNVWSASTIIRVGRGTPLPTRMANALVTTGPHALVRNPMCVSALAQGMAVAIGFASPLTAFYVALGGVVWHVVVRPAEKDDLRERFGAAYDKYRRRVSLWLPGRSVVTSPVGPPT